MANDFEVGVDVGVPPDEAWKLFADQTASWFPAVRSAEVRDGMRYAVMADGRRLVERIVEHDDAARIHSYSVVEGTATPLRSHLATISVEEAPGGCRIRWRTVAEPEDPSVDLEARIGPGLRMGLDNAKAILEDAG